MTDNYQIDKNSKLFQKFLNLKQAKQPNSTASDLPNPLNPPFLTSNNPQPNLQTSRLKLHVTVSDI